MQSSSDNFLAQLAHACLQVKNLTEVEFISLNNPITDSYYHEKLYFKQRNWSRTQ